MLSRFAKDAPGAQNRAQNWAQAGAVEVDVPEVDTAPLLDALSEAQRAGATRRGSDKEAAAHRLRARGFSYRRIAETLRIRYDIVSRWMLGDPPPEPAPLFHEVVPPRLPRAASPPPAPAAGAPAAASLERRLAALEATLDRFQAEAAAREERLLAELGALRAVLEAAPPAGWQLPWSRGRERA